jgi:cytochrome P450 family 144
VLHAVLEQTRDVALDPDRQPEWVDSLLVRRHHQLHITATAR